MNEYTNSCYGCIPWNKWSVMVRFSFKFHALVMASLTLEVSQSALSMKSMFNMALIM